MKFQKPKIIHTESSDGWGGQEIRILEEANLFETFSDFSCEILASETSQFVDRNPYSNLRLHLGKISKKKISGLKDLISKFNHLEPDIVVTHSSTDSWLVVLAKFFVRKSYKIIRVRHVSAPIKANLMTRWMYRQPEKIVTTSKAIKKHIEEVVGVAADDVFSIPTGVDVEKYSPVSPAEKNLIRKKLGLKLETVYLIMVSTLRSWKGHSFVIHALQDIPNCELLIVGDGPQEENLLNQVEALGLKKRVSFLGYRKDIPDILKASDIFLQPSYANEGVSQSLLQACATGLPCVAGDITGLNELITHKKNGFLVAPKSSLEISQAVKAILYDDDMSNLGINARENVVNHHSLYSMYLKMNDVVKSVL